MRPAVAAGSALFIDTLKSGNNSWKRRCAVMISYADRHFNHCAACCADTIAVMVFGLICCLSRAAATPCSNVRTDALWPGSVCPSQATGSLQNATVLPGWPQSWDGKSPQDCQRACETSSPACLSWMVSGVGGMQCVGMPVQCFLHSTTGIVEPNLCYQQGSCDECSGYCNVMDPNENCRNLTNL